MSLFPMLDNVDLGNTPLEGYQSYDYAEIAFTVVPAVYVVGTNAYAARNAVFGDAVGKTGLVAKRMILYATQNCTIVLNNLLNLAITLQNNTYYVLPIRTLFMMVTRVGVDGVLRVIFLG